MEFGWDFTSVAGILHIDWKLDKLCDLIVQDYFKQSVA